MAIITYTSRVRADTISSDGWPTCCGIAPKVITWSKGIGKGMIAVSCRNPECENRIGVLECDTGIREKWERYRVKSN